METVQNDGAEDTRLSETDLAQTELQSQTSEVSTTQGIPASTVLRRGHKILVDFLDPYSILHRFSADEFIPLRDIRDIAEMKNTSEKNNGILKKIRSKGDNGYASLKTYLALTGQNLLLNCLNVIEQGENIESLIQQLESQQRVKMSKALQEQQMTTDVLQLVRLLKGACEKTKGLESGQDLIISIHIKTPRQKLKHELEERILKDATTVLEMDQYDEEQHAEENKSLVPWIHYIFSFIRAIGAKIISFTRGSMLLRIKCLSVGALHDLLVAVHSVEFYDLVHGLESTLNQETGEEVEIKTKVLSANLHTVKENLVEQGVIEDISCEIMCDRHTDMLLQNYCFTHDVCCCKMCTEHIDCPGLTEVKTDRATVKEIKEERLELQNRRDYDVKIPDDDTTCNIVYFCLLEDGTFLLADNANKKLKKLSSSYRVIDHVDIHDYPRHLCGIGKGRVVLTTRPSTVRSKPQIHVIETKYKLRVDMSTELPCAFARTAYHNEIIYLSSIEGIYAYNTDLTQIAIFKESRDLFQSFDVPIAISDSGENIYVSDHLKIFTFDRNGCLLFTSESTYKFITDIFTLNESSILVADTIAKELVIDNFKKEQKKIHIPKVVDIATVYFNRKSSSVLIGVSDSDEISMFNLPTSVLQD